jgi:hypothetical protein
MLHVNYKVVLTQIPGIAEKPSIIAFLGAFTRGQLRL